MIPTNRIHDLNQASPNPSGEYVLYWMVAARRPRWNFALQHAADRAKEHDVGLVVLEALEIDYPWACRRFHRFILDGMRDNLELFQRDGVRYHPYVEPKPGAARGLLTELAQHAVQVVTDDYPTFFLPRIQAAAARALEVPLEVVDGNGVLPMRDTQRVFLTAHSFRRHIQITLAKELPVFPKQDPLRSIAAATPSLRREVLDRWPPPAKALLDSDTVPDLEFENDVPEAGVPGGPRAGSRRLKGFLDRLGTYDEDRNHPDRDGASGLSPYLHFGHVGAHEVVHRLLGTEDWTPEKLSPPHNGRRAGWWGLSESAEAFLDQVITWRELGFNMTALRDDADQYDSLPPWARETLEDHADDPRDAVYTLEEFAQARTHDEVWNAAQNQLATEGVLHNYMRMLWGKKILEWSGSPREALDTMIELNNRYALDGRDPNSLSGIFWVLGRYDRPWGPERPVFGKIRFMSSDNTRRKLRVKEYLARYSPDSQTSLELDTDA